MSDGQAGDTAGVHPPPQHPFAFVDDLAAPVLSAADHHHLARVRRIDEGDLVVLSDGAGTWRLARLGVEPEVVGPIVRVPRPEPAITIGFALVKGSRTELAVQKLTELGADRILPFVAERSVVRWDEARAARNIDRLRLVAREAAMQSRRCWLPTLDEVHTFDAAADLTGVVRADRGGVPPSLRAPAVLIGPEGGWSDRERERVEPAVGLGDHVLRSETAAITAAALLCGLRSGLVSGALPGRQEVPRRLI